MLDKSKGRDQTECSFWSSRLGVEREANDHNPERFTLMKPWRRPRRAHRVVAPVKKEKICVTYFG
jgi:hypothetical protein